MKLEFHAGPVELLIVVGRELDRGDLMEQGFALRLGSYVFCRPARLGPYRWFNHRTFDFTAHRARYKA